jgi:hypothetical protein
VSGVVAAVRDTWSSSSVHATVSDLPDETFDEFCERLNVTTEELPHAFAAWLGRSFDLRRAIRARRAGRGQLAGAVDVGDDAAVGLLGGPPGSQDA